ncbi:MAG: hypothetical protein NW703_07055 [Nitrospiraceae bacterium]
MGFCFVRASIYPPFNPSLSMRLENHPIPGRPQNYRIVFRSPASVPEGLDCNLVDIGAEPREWSQEVPLSFIEEIQRLIRTPITMQSHADIGLDRPGYEVRFGEFGQEAIYRWYGRDPTGWEPLQAIVSRLASYTGEYTYM